MLLVWAKGMVFARTNHLPLVVSSWWGLHWGALARRERKPRLYIGYFRETPLIKRIAIRVDILFRKVIAEPPLREIENKRDDHAIFLFTKVITNEDLFFGLRDHRELIVSELYGMLSLKMKRQLDTYSASAIGVHIRRGDFKLGNQTTPLEYFINAINLIRHTLDENLPVTVFTDADSTEISELLELPNITLAENKPDILDILLLSKSEIMILSRSSTFGYWAAFLSDALVIRPHNDWQHIIKKSEAGAAYREVKWDYTDEYSNRLLAEAINHGPTPLASNI